MKRLILLLAFLRIVKTRCPHRHDVPGGTKQWQCSRAVHSTGTHRLCPRPGRWVVFHLDPHVWDWPLGLVIALLVATCTTVPWLWLADAAGGGR